MLSHTASHPVWGRETLLSRGIRVWSGLFTLSMFLSKVGAVNIFGKSQISVSKILTEQGWRLYTGICDSLFSHLLSKPYWWAIKFLFSRKLIVQSLHSTAWWIKLSVVTKIVWPFNHWIKVHKSYIVTLVTHKWSLRWFLGIASRIPTAHDFCVNSVRTWARARTKRKRFPQI